jgi:predicted phosphohydrolase
VARGGFRKLTPADTVALHRADLAWLEAALATPFAGETIVVTHHAPIPPSPARDMDAAYGSDLTAITSRHKPKAWLFGHIHREQTARIGRTDVRNVSLGYPSEWAGRTDQIAGHLAALVLDL